MKKVIGTIIMLSALIMLLPVAGFTHTAENPLVTPLLAGQDGLDVGDVLIWNDATNIYVKYVVTDPSWCLSQTHLEVQQSFSNIPQTKKFNPIPGKFYYGDQLDCAFEQLYTVPLNGAPGTTLYIAAHSVLQTLIGYTDPKLDALAAALPELVTMSIKDPYVGAPAYFPTVTITGEPLTGAYEGWCVDTDLPITQDVLYTANVFSSYETLPAGVVEFPENLDLINWITNQNFVGKPSSCQPLLPTYTYGDVQRAIWTLIEDTNSTLSLGPYSRCHVDEIVAAAYANGEGFVPGCNDLVGIIFQPIDASQIIIAQATFAGVGVPCDPIFEYETAWGDGFDFSGDNWATYFTYIVQ
jgi:hypothetical protein